MSSVLRRRSSRRRATAAKIAALVLAVLCHGLVVLFLLVTGAFQQTERMSTPLLFSSHDQPSVESDSPPMEIESLVERLDRPEELTREEQKRKKEEESTRPQGQVVDIARPTVEQRPDDARYLAEYDSKVSRETKGKTGRDKAGAQVASEPTPSVAPVPPVPASAGAPGALALHTPRHEQNNQHDPADVKEFGPDGTVSRHLPTQAPAPDRTGGGGRPGQRPQPNLLGTPEVLARALGMGPGSMDYLRDVDDGESTALNAKKWKFASFFNRLKKSVADEWHPDTVFVRHDPSGNIYGVKDRVTVLRVHLSPDGRLVNVQITQPSGIDFLDDEASSAFKRAQPFLNPPAQLVESDGQINFNFAFIFELSGHTSFKVFRY